MTVGLSAIIPTRDRPAYLRDCLRSLAAQTAAGDSLEVIVVDDGSQPPLESAVDLGHLGPLDVRFVRQPPSGLNVARNEGARHARGGILAFLDDDVLADREWAAAVLDAFDRTGCDAVAGRITLAYEGPRPRWLSDDAHGYLSALDRGDDPEWLPPDQEPFGANCAVRRAAFERVSGFRHGLDRVGASLVSNGDIDFFRRVRATGGRVLYWPRAHVRHRVPAARLTAAWFRRRGYAQGVSDGLLVRVGAGRWARLRELARVLLWFARTPLIAAKGAVARRSLVETTIWIAYCRGRLSVLVGRATPT